MSGHDRFVSGLKRRFLERVRKEGIPVDPPLVPKLPFWKFAAVAAGLILAAFAGYSWRAQQPVRPPAIQAETRADAQELAVLAGRVAELERQLSDARLPAPTAPRAEVANLARERQLTDELGAASAATMKMH